MTEKTNVEMVNEVLLKHVPNVNTETGEIVGNEMVIQETNEYKIVKLEDGSYKKNMKYQQYFSRRAETEEEQIELYKVFNDSESGLVTPLSNMTNKEIVIKHVFMQPYESFDEKSGNLTAGVTTTIEDIDGTYYATSSKSVYYTLLNIMQTFGEPDNPNYKPVKVKVTGTKRQNGVQINLSLIGRA